MAQETTPLAERNYGGISNPKEGDFWQVGDTVLYVFDVEEDAREYGAYGYRRDGRTVVTCHDNDGNEVEIHFFPFQSEEDDDE